MDHRTTMRELDEVIIKAQAATGRESAEAEALPDCELRRRKERQVRATRAYVDRLRAFRTALKARRRSGSLLH